MHNEKVVFAIFKEDQIFREASEEKKRMKMCNKLNWSTEYNGFQHKSKRSSVKNMALFFSHSHSSKLKRSIDAQPNIIHSYKIEYDRMQRKNEKKIKK